MAPPLLRFIQVNHVFGNICITLTNELTNVLATLLKIDLVYGIKLPTQYLDYEIKFKLLTPQERSEFTILWYQISHTY